MEKNNLVYNLVKYGYSFQEYEDKVIISTDSKLRINVNFSNEKIKIKSELIGWNFLSGIMDMKFENAVRYVMITSIICIFALMVVKSMWGNLLPILLFTCVIIWTASSVSYYNVKIENMKIRIYFWMKN